MNKIQLTYKVPITVLEIPSQGETGVTDFLIQGIAINSTLTDNKHKFVAEELEKASHTLNNVPLLKDHDIMVDSIVGRVVHSEFNSSEENITFRARINDTDAGKHIKQLIKNGDLNTVSIGANVEKLDEEDGVFIPRGIQFKELSLVAVPADEDAKFSFKGGDFQLALREAYKSINQKSHSLISESNVVTEKQLNEKEKQMKEDNKSKLTEQEEVKEPEKEEEKEEDSEVKAEVEALSKSVKAQSNLIAQLISEIKVKQADVDEEEPEKEPEAPAEEVKPEPEPSETKESVEEPEEKSDEDSEEEVKVDEKSRFRIVRNYNSFTVLRNKY